MFFTIIVLALFYPLILLFSFDKIFRKQHRFKAFFINVLFMFLLVLNTVAALPIVGSLLSISLFVMPAIVAAMLARNLPDQSKISLIVSFFSVYIGAIISHKSQLPIGPAITVIMGDIFDIRIYF